MRSEKIGGGQIVEQALSVLRRTRESIAISCAAQEEMERIMRETLNRISQTQRMIDNTDTTLRNFGPLCSRDFAAGPETRSNPLST
jgi:hypothetical protein